MKAEKLKHNTKKKPRPKNQNKYFDQYRDLFDLRMKPVTDRFIEQLALDLLRWAETDEALIMRQFWDGKKISANDYYRWKEKNENLKKAHEYALSVVGTRRELGGLKREFSERMVIHTMPKYHKEWKELEEWKSKLRDTQEEKKDSVVVIERYPSSDKVPERFVKKIIEESNREE